MGDTGRSAFDLTDEEYQQFLSDPESLEQEQDPNQDPDPGQEQDPDPDPDPGQEYSFETEETPGSAHPQSAQPPADPAPGPSSSQQVTLVHNGQQITVPLQEAINLAQKGFDYERKTAQIAPHRRLIELIEQDEGLQEVINRHVVKKVIPQASKRDEFSSEEEWLQDNLERIMAKTSPVFQRTEESTPTGQTVPQGMSTETAPTQESPIVQALRQRDPENFDNVKGHLTAAIRNLTVQQYAEVTQDPNKVFEFYDQVKTQVQSPQQARPASSRAPRKPTFNLRGGTTGQPRTPEKKNVWNLSNKEFSNILQQVKGY